MIGPDRLNRLLDVLLPARGNALLLSMLEAYFDESGDFEVDPGIFALCGYVIN